MTREVMALVFFTMAGLGCVYCLAAALVMVIFRPGERHRARRMEPVTVLKPLCGSEPGLYDRLRSFCTQNYPAPVQVVLGIQRTDDPAFGAARRLAREFPDGVQVVSSSTRIGANRKVSNLVNMVKAARHDVLVMSDSDIEVEPDYLLRLVAHLQADGVGAVTCLYHGVSRSCLWSRLCALAINAYFLPNAAMALRLGLAHPCFGSTVVIRRETLSAVGGLEAFANHLADDYAIGMAVRRLGLRIAVADFTVGHVCNEKSLAALWRQELRWARTVRALDPVGWAGSAITHPFALALIGALLETAQGVWFITLALTCRCALCMATERRFSLGPLPYRLIPLRDVLHFAIFVSSFAGRAVRWRDQAYDVTADGVIQTEEAVQ